MCMCEKCGKMCGVLVLALGILFLLQDLNVWNFWNIKWYTAVFVLVGLGALLCGKCPECNPVVKKKR